MTLETRIAELRRRAELLPREDSRRVAARQHLRDAEEHLRDAERSTSAAARTLDRRLEDERLRGSEIIR
jgi:hypothetical protein